MATEELPAPLRHGFLGREIVSRIPDQYPLDWETAVHQNPDVAFYLAIQFNNKKQVARILQTIKYGNVPIRNISKGFVLAAKFNRPTITKMLLEARDSTEKFLLDPAADGNHAIQLASYLGRTKIVELLLSARNDAINDPADPGSWRVDPAANNNYAIRMAATENHESTALRLLEAQNDDETWRVNPAVKRNKVLEEVIIHGNEELLRRLLKDKKKDGRWRVNVTSAIVLAVAKGRRTLAQMLLEAKNPDGTWRGTNSEVLLRAMYHAPDIALVKLLLDAKNTDEEGNFVSWRVTYDDDLVDHYFNYEERDIACLLLGAENPDGSLRVQGDIGWTLTFVEIDIMLFQKLLLARDPHRRYDPYGWRVDAAYNNNAPIRTLAKYGEDQGKVKVKLLLEARNPDGTWRVDPAANDNEALRNAKKRGDTKMMAALEGAVNDDGTRRVPPL